MKFNDRFVAQAVVLILVLLGNLYPIPARAQLPPREVLILNSYHAGYSWTDEQTAGIRYTLRRGGFVSDPVIEYMDWKRLPFPENLELLHRLFRYKYADKKFAVLFVTDNAALQFALRYREEIFKGAKIVFCGVNGYTPAMLEGQKDVTGVAEEVDPAGTLDVALQLHPNAKEVLVVFDGTESGREARDSVARKVAKYAGRVKFRFLDDPLVSEVRDAVRSLAPGDFVLQGTYSRDREGRTYNIADVVKLVAPHSPVPIYGLWEAMVGKGIIGGSLLSGRIQGETAGKLGLRILSGEPVAQIPVIEKTPMALMFDYRQLERFGMERAPLPRNAIVINRPFSFYTAYRRTIWTFIGIISLLTGTVIGLLVNISARRRAEVALQREKEYIEQIVSVAPTMICTVAHDGKTLSVNQAVLEATGYHRDEVTGLDWWRHFPQHQVSQVKQLLSERREGPLLNHEMTLVTKGGEQRVISWNMISHLHAGAAGPKVIGIGVDITERKLAEEAREQVLRELESSNKELESIVYVASHDLRSPLVNIQGFSRKLGKACKEVGLLLQTSSLSPKEHQALAPLLETTIPRALHFITHSVEKMDSLLGGLLRLSRLGRKALNIEPLDMDLLVDEVLASMTYQVQKVEGTVTRLPLPHCLGDAVQINQVFSNLLDNAIKYRHPQRPLEITVFALIKGSEAIYCVRDNGIGIPPAQQPKIWEVFHRLDPSGEVEGEGLGLTMVRRILDRSNGRVWVESAPGKGTSFFVALPQVEEFVRRLDAA